MHKRDTKHPFDGITSPKEMAERQSGKQVLPLLEGVMKHLVEQGCGAEEAIFVCLAAAQYGAAWYQDHRAELGENGRRVFDRLLKLAEEHLVSGEG